MIYKVTKSGCPDGPPLLATFWELFVFYKLRAIYKVKWCSKKWHLLFDSILLFFMFLNTFLIVIHWNSFHHDACHTFESTCEITVHWKSSYPIENHLSTCRWNNFLNKHDITAHSIFTFDSKHRHSFKKLIMHWKFFKIEKWN